MRAVAGAKVLRSRARWVTGLSSLAVVVLLASGCGSATTPVAGWAPMATASPHPVDPAIHKIAHVVVIQQENRSFDSYFGTYPGADGLPGRNHAQVPTA